MFEVAESLTRQFGSLVRAIHKTVESVLLCQNSHSDSELDICPCLSYFRVLDTLNLLSPKYLWYLLEFSIFLPKFPIFMGVAHQV